MKINGVVGVIDEISVLPVFRRDSDIANAVRRRILNSSVIESQGIWVTCSDGIVSITGQVGSYAESEQAALLASEVAGVKEVRNLLTIKWATQRSDEEIKKDAIAALARDVYLTGLPITVEVKDGVVTLEGLVGNAYEKERAKNDVRWVSNVKGVVNNIDVEWYEDQGVRKQAVIPSDSELKAAVRKVLDQDHRLNADNITLRTSFGHVILDGSVFTHHEREIAEQDARNVPGVAWVTNNLFTRVDKREDWAIADDIMFNLATDSLIDGFNIETTVKNGIVTLSGTVHSAYDKAHAADVASRVRGVKGVVNNLVVSSTNWKKDAELVKSIKRGLRTDWTTWWVARKINVTVKDGVAVLEGDVNSWKQRTKAAEIALHTFGILEVDNRLTVKGVAYPWDEHLYK